MPFEIGKPKTGGRAPGVQNKNKVNLKQKIQAIAESQFENLENDLDLMEGKDRVGFVLKLLPYLLPTQKETKIDFN